MSAGQFFDRLGIQVALRRFPGVPLEQITSKPSDSRDSI